MIAAYSTVGTSRSVQLTQVDRCAPSEIHLVTGNCTCVFTIPDFFTNRKLIYDFLLVINCDLSCISHLSGMLAQRSRKPAHPIMSLRSKGSRLNFAVELTAQNVEVLCYFSVILVSVILSQYTRVVTDYRRTLRCSCWLRKRTVGQPRTVIYIVCNTGTFSSRALSKSAFY